MVQMLMPKTMNVKQHFFGPPPLVTFNKVDQNICIEIDKSKMYSGHEGIVDLLIKNGADVNVINEDNNTALIFAAARGEFQIENSQIDRNFCIEIDDSLINLFR